MFELGSPVVFVAVAAYFASVLCATFLLAGRSDYGVFVVVSDKSEIANLFLSASRANTFFAALFGTGRRFNLGPFAEGMFLNRDFLGCKYLCAHSAFGVTASFCRASSFFIGYPLACDMTYTQRLVSFFNLAAIYAIVLGVTSVLAGCGMHFDIVFVIGKFCFGIDVLVAAHRADVFGVALRRAGGSNHGIDVIVLSETGFFGIGFVAAAALVRHFALFSASAFGAFNFDIVVNVFSGRNHVACNHERRSVATALSGYYVHSQRLIDARADHERELGKRSVRASGQTFANKFVSVYVGYDDNRGGFQRAEIHSNLDFFILFDRNVHVNAVLCGDYSVYGFASERYIFVVFKIGIDDVAAGNCFEEVAVLFCSRVVSGKGKVIQRVQCVYCVAAVVVFKRTAYACGSRFFFVRAYRDCNDGDVATRFIECVGKREFKSFFLAFGVKLHVYVSAVAALCIVGAVYNDIAINFFFAVFDSQNSAAMPRT